MNEENKFKKWNDIPETWGETLFAQMYPELVKGLEDRKIALEQERLLREVVD
jgi:hypothetical protein